MSLYEVAFHLSIPLYELMDKMTYEEFSGWVVFLEKRPIGWRDDYRAYMIMQAQGVKEQPWKLFDSLKTIFNKHNPATDSLQGSKVFHWLAQAKGGDKVDLFKKEDLE